MKPSSFDAKFFTDSHELDKKKMINGNFYINFFDGCPDDLKIEKIRIP